MWVGGLQGDGPRRVFPLLTLFFAPACARPHNGFVPTGFAPLERVALLFIHPMKSGGTSVRFAMHKLNGDEWTHVGRTFCFRAERDMTQLREPGFLDAHLRLYFEFHCSPYDMLGPRSSLWTARDFLQRKGWKVVTATLLRDPVPTVPSYYAHFGPGHPRRGLEAKLGASLAGFVASHFDFVLCTIWGVSWICERPLDSAEEDDQRSIRVPLADAPHGADAFSLLSPRLQRIAAALAAPGRERDPAVPAMRRAFGAFVDTLTQQQQHLVSGCGEHAPRGPVHAAMPALADSHYMHCERAPFRALERVQTAWAAFQAAVRVAEPALCDRQLRELDARLARLDVVGVCERWDETFLLLARRLGLQRFPRVVVNVKEVSPEQRSQQQAVSAQLAVSEGCATRLYRKWARSFGERVRQEGADFNATLARLRASFNGAVVQMTARPLHPRAGRNATARAALHWATLLARRREKLLGHRKAQRSPFGPPAQRG